MRNASLLLLLGLALGGCVHVQEHRARHLRDAYGSYDTAKQTRLLEATIARGDQPEAVYVALGPPTVRFPRGEGEAWLYVGHAGESTGDTLTFGSRAANDWGGDQQELIVLFRDEAAVDWLLQPLSDTGMGLTNEAQRQRDAGELVTWRGPRINRDPYLPR
ncbi:MAG: hypothetical protein Q7P63_02535 [Verrucomicrobiota bacterium JB022]|nr:hypothetical protein [Verrucomicrobiota bacterium JB022]